MKGCSFGFLDFVAWFVGYMVLLSAFFTVVFCWILHISEHMKKPKQDKEYESWFV